MTIEGRKYVRFPAKDNSFAAIRNGFQKVGKIDDISINGLSFSFLSKFTQANSTGQHTQIDLFNSEDEFHISNMYCRIVYEISDPKPYKGFDVRMSHCGLQYEDVTKSQLEQLELFMEKYTTGTLDEEVT